MDEYHGIGGTYIVQPDGSRLRVIGTADDAPPTDQQLVPAETTFQQETEKPPKRKG